MKMQQKAPASVAAESEGQIVHSQAPSDCHKTEPASTAWWETPHASQLSTYLAEEKPALTASPPRHKAGLKEEEDDYPYVIVMAGRYRVVQCRDDIQWIVQWWSGGRWRGGSYHRDREALLEQCRLRGIDDAALAELSKLPRWKL